MDKPLVLSETVDQIAIFTLNLNLFYGISENVGYALPRTLTVVDATVLLAVANCAALLWHASVFKGECSASAECQDQLRTSFS